MGRREKNDYERGSEAPQVLYSPLSYGDNLHYEKFADGSVKCIEDEIPFDLPEGWAWCRLSMVGATNIGLTYKPTEVKETGTIVLRSCNIKNGKINFADLVRVQADIRENQYIYKNDILICARNGSQSLVGKCAIMQDLPEAASFGAFMAVFRSICNQYVYYYFNTSLFRSSFSNDDSKQINQVTQAILRDTLIPLPPFAEQTRIVAKLHEILSLADFINDGTEQIEMIITNAKSKILDLAIRGQLVPQDPADEPASVLLERIRAEKEELIKQGKIKRDKKESFIFRGEDNSYYEKIDMEVRCINSEIPFDLPETWCWCRLGTLFAHNTGKALNSADSAGTPMTYITTSNLYWDRFELDSLKEMLFADSEIDKCTVKKGDLLVCEGGDIGRSAIWMFEENIRIQNHIHRLRPYISLSNRFYYYVMYMWKQLGLIGGQGIGLQGFSSKMLHNLIVPLPSIDEQERIVAFIDKLFEQIESIEKSFS